MYTKGTDATVAVLAAYIALLVAPILVGGAGLLLDAFS